MWSGDEEDTAEHRTQICTMRTLRTEKGNPDSMNASSLYKVGKTHIDSSLDTSDVDMLNLAQSLQLDSDPLQLIQRKFVLF